jgi:hypothetical protein
MKIRRYTDKIMRYTDIEIYEVYCQWKLGGILTRKIRSYATNKEVRRKWGATLKISSAKVRKYAENEEVYWKRIPIFLIYTKFPSSYNNKNTTLLVQHNYILLEKR